MAARGLDFQTRNLRIPDGLKQVSVTAGVRSVRLPVPLEHRGGRLPTARSDKTWVWLVGDGSSTESFQQGNSRRE